MSTHHKNQFLKRFKDVYYIDYRMFIILVYLYIIFVLTILFVYQLYSETSMLLINNKLETSKLLMRLHNRFEIFEYVETDKKGIITKAQLFEKL
tara:strand:+ start:2880 stop:3161 length:282 start_codon:yes stop_codon:yes gene_type:complete